MAAQKGSAMLMKVGNGGSPETFTTIAGLRSTSLTINNESVDVTNKDSSGKRTMLAAAGVHASGQACVLVRGASALLRRGGAQLYARPSDAARG